MRHLSLPPAGHVGRALAITRPARRATSAAARLRRMAGLTLVEAMVTLAILSMLLTAAVPMLVDYVANSRLREAGHLLLGEALMAQSEAVKRNASTRLDTDGQRIQVFDLSNPGAPALLRERLVATQAALPTASITFSGEGRPSPFGTPAALNLSPVTGTCSADLRCPGLRIDAGGAARLCPNHLDNCP